MYGNLFSKLYDAMGWNYYPETFAESLITWMQRENAVIKTSLDIGCGPGILAGILKEHGIQASGMDLSQAMVDIASEKYPDVSFFQGNMITFKPEHPMDLVTATCDAINHLLDQKDLGQTFETVYGYLNPGGYFIFDALRDESVLNLEPTDIGEIDGTQAKYQVQKKENGMTLLQTDFYKEENLVHSEQIWERIYDAEVLAQMLEKAGFLNIRFQRRLLEEQKAGIDWIVLAKK